MYIIKVTWDALQVVDIEDKAYLRHNAILWYIWSSLFETQCKFLIYMIKRIWDSVEIFDMYDQAYLRGDAISWYIW